MANNTYGTVKQALFNPAVDADVYYYYKPTRSSESPVFSGFKKIENVESVLQNSVLEEPIVGNDRRLPGMYDLKLPVSIFGNKGFYTVYIVPKEFECTIKDIGSLVAYPDIRGIVIDMNEVSEYRPLFADDNLTGYRIEYFNYDNAQGAVVRQEYYRLVTSCGFCQPVSQNTVTSTSSSTGYAYNASGSLCFITVTPSTAPSFKSNSIPYIGVPNQKIVIKNTKFDPVCLEIEIADHDIETVSYMLEGEQLRNLENGRVSNYNFDGEIYKQFEYATVKDNYNKKNIAEIKLNKSGNIDRTFNIEDFRN